MSKPFDPALPNQFDKGLMPAKIRARYFEEYIGLTPLSVFMGTSPSDAVQVFEMKSGEGMTYRVPFRKDLNYEHPVIGFNQASGSGQQISFYQDEIRLDLRRFADGLVGQTIVKQQTPIDVFGSLRPSLLTLSQKNLVKSLLDAATTDVYNDKGGRQGPVDDRVIYCGAKYDPTIDTACDGMTGATCDKSGLSVDHIRRLKSIAMTGGHSFEKEAKIRPIDLKTKKGFPEETYVFLMDPDSYYSLCKDPDWSSQVHRGMLQTADQPEGLSGARFRGMIEGVMIYECVELARYRRTTESKKVAAWNLFLGGQALGLCWAKRPIFREEKRDFADVIEIAVCEVRGQKSLQFPSFQNPSITIERGIVHSFTQIK